MSTSSAVYSARINTPVHISLTRQLSSTSQRATSDEASTTFSRSESCPRINHPLISSVRHGSLTLTVGPPVATTSTRRLCVSIDSQAATSRMPVNHVHDSRTGNLGLRANLISGINGVHEQHRDAPVPPRLPDYTEIEPPPPYNPDFLVPMSCHRWSDVVGRRSSSMSASCPPPPPPSRRSSTAEVHPRSSLPLIAEQRLMDDDDDDVFFTEKPTTFGHGPET